MAKIANVALTNTFNTWRTNSNIAFDRLSQFAIDNSSLYANTITANVAFTSKGLATLQGRATVGTNLTVSGNTTLGAAGKTITSTGAAAHTGTKTISTNLTVSGNTTLGAAGKTITSTGAAAHTGTQSVSTNLTVSGNTSTNKATVTSSLTVSGNTTLGAAGKTITSTGAAAHTGTKTISTNLTVSGNTSTNKATVTSLLTVSGNTTIGRTTGGPFFGAHNGTVGATTANTGSFTTIGATGLVTLSGRATVGTNLTVTGNTDINSSGANGVYSNTASFGVFSNNVNFSSKKIRNFTEDAMSYRASSTTITLSAVRNVQRISLTGNATVTLPTGMPGKAEAIKTIVVIFKQDATGSRTMAFAAPSGETLLYNNSATLPAVSSAANKVTIYVCTKFDGDTRWYISQSFIEA